jgi:hypothetical protein
MTKNKTTLLGVLLLTFTISASVHKLTVINRAFASQSAKGARAVADALCTKAGQFCVNRETSSGTCHAQEATERPQLGPNLKGPFSSRTDGNTAMCALYDAGSADSNKCGAVAPTGVCDSVKKPK